MQKLTLEQLLKETINFVEFVENEELKLFGVTDGKAVGTLIEQKFKSFLTERYNVDIGSSAKGIDFPSLNIDVKVTSEKQPQSSSPFKDAKQKIYGLGYNLLIFVYTKSDDEQKRISKMKFENVIYIQDEYTADYQITKNINQVLRNGGNVDDISALLIDRNLPLDHDFIQNLSIEIIKSPPNIGYLTISNALQWRLQYRRAIDFSNEKSSYPGLLRVR